MGTSLREALLPIASTSPPHFIPRVRRAPLDGANMKKLSIDERLTKLAGDLRTKAALLLQGAEQLALLSKAKMFEAQVGMNALFNART